MINYYKYRYIYGCYDLSPEEIIDNSFNDPINIKFAQSMASFIRGRLNSQRIGRRLLMVDDLPQGALVNYKQVKNIPDKIMRKKKF